MDVGLLCYLAGAMDCDGSVNVLRSHRTRADGSPVTRFIPRLTFVQVNPEVVNLFYETFGGNVYFYTAPKREGTRGWHQWYVAGANAVRVAQALLPHLRLKHDAATALIELGELQRTFRERHNGQRHSPEEIAQRLALADRVRESNARRAHARFNGRQHEGTPSAAK